MHRALRVAAQDHRLLAHARDEEVARLRDQALMPDEQPGAGEQFLQFLAVEFRRDEDLAADRAALRSIIWSMGSAVVICRTSPWFGDCAPVHGPRVKPAGAHTGRDAVLIQFCYAGASGTEERSMFQKLHHVAYRCRDAQETVEFYTKVLGLKYAAGQQSPEGARRTGKRSTSSTSSSNAATAATSRSSTCPARRRCRPIRTRRTGSTTSPSRCPAWTRCRKASAGWRRPASTCSAEGPQLLPVDLLLRPERHPAGDDGAHRGTGRLDQMEQAAEGAARGVERAQAAQLRARAMPETAMQGELVALEVPRGSGYDSQSGLNNLFPQVYGRLAADGCGKARRLRRHPSDQQLHGPLPDRPAAAPRPSRSWR